MLLDIPEIKDKNLAKLIKKLNESYDKKKMDKVEDGIKELGQELSKKGDNANLLLYGLSIIAEELPQFITESILTTVKEFLTQKEVKPKLNALIIYGSYLLHQMEEKDELQISDLNTLVGFLKDPVEDFRQNTAVFLEQIPATYDIQLLSKLNEFLEILKLEKNLEVMRTTAKLIKRLQPKLSLSPLISFVNKLSIIYSDSDLPERNDLILSMLETELPILKERKKKSWNKKDTLNAINNRTPLMRIHEIKALVKETGLEEEKVLEQLRSGIDEKIIYPFEYSEKNRKYFVEFERIQLVALLGKSKIKVDEFADIFKDTTFDNRTIINVLIKDLVKNHLIKGFLAKEYFYSEDYLKNELLQKLQREGRIHLPTYVSFINQEYVDKILKGISELSTYTGMFDLKKEYYYTFSSLLKEIEAQTSKNSVVDLTDYKEKFDVIEFQKFEDAAHKQFFTDFTKNHVWLTNLGLTRIQNYNKTREQIGLFDRKLAEKELAIPIHLLDEVLKNNFDNKDGFWNKEKSKFYFAKYVKKEVSAIQNEKDDKKQNLKIDQLAKELDLDRQEIAKRVHEKTEAIIKRVNKTEAEDLNKLLKEINMDFPELVSFLERNGKSYLVVNNKIFLSDKKVDEEKQALKITLENEANKSDLVDFTKLSTNLKCSKPILIDLFKSLPPSKIKKGIWIKEDQFLTESGIIAQMKKSKSYISLSTFIETRTLNGDEIAILEAILIELQNQNILKGIFDKESKVFQTEDIQVETNVATERKKFSDEIGKYLQGLEFAYNTVRDIFLLDDLNPAQISEYEKILNEASQQSTVYENRINQMISSATMRIKNTIKKVNRDEKREKDEDMAKQVPDLRKDEVIGKLINDFYNWKQLLVAIQQKAGNIAFLKKRIKNNPEDEESQTKLKNTLEYLRFI